MLEGMPHKILNFGLKAINNGLATQCNKMRRKIVPSGTCEVCGVGEESTMHALAWCPHAVSLRQLMRQQWLLPDEEQFSSLTPEKLLVKLSELGVDEGARKLLLLYGGHGTFGTA